MEAMECILTRRSNRRFTRQSVPEELLTQVVEAGRCAASGGNSQSFRFIVITNRDVLNRLKKLVQDEFAAMEIREGMYGSLVNSITRARQGDYAFHYDPAAFVIVSNKKDFPNAMADSACALQNMMLACNALGLGSCWINQLHWLDSFCGMTGGHPAVDAYLRDLGLPGDETVCGALSIGWPDPLVRHVTSRKSPVSWIR